MIYHISSGYTLLKLYLSCLVRDSFLNSVFNQNSLKVIVLVLKDTGKHSARFELELITVFIHGFYHYLF